MKIRFKKKNKRMELDYAQKMLRAYKKRLKEWDEFDKKLKIKKK